MIARVLSVNVGLPRAVHWGGRTVRTAIFKEPVAGRVAVRRHNLAGDAQADLRVHGGEKKAVYAYPHEHYAWWRELLGRELEPGAFGENLTIEGLLETEARVGDRLRIGTAVLAVTQPRMPCYKLGIRFGDDAFVQRFLESDRPGFYLAIVEEGEVGAGDAIERAERAEGSPTVLEVFRSKRVRTRRGS